MLRTPRLSVDDSDTFVSFLADNEHDAKQSQGWRSTSAPGGLPAYPPPSPSRLSPLFATPKRRKSQKTRPTLVVIVVVLSGAVVALWVLGLLPRVWRPRTGTRSLKFNKPQRLYRENLDPDKQYLTAFASAGPSE